MFQLKNTKKQEKFQRSEGDLS